MVREAALGAAAAAAVGTLGAATAGETTASLPACSTVAIRVQNIVLIFSAAVAAAVASTVKQTAEEPSVELKYFLSHNLFMLIKANDLEFQNFQHQNFYIECSLYSLQTPSSQPG